MQTVYTDSSSWMLIKGFVFYKPRFKCPDLNFIEQNRKAVIHHLTVQSKSYDITSSEATFKIQKSSRPRELPPQSLTQPDVNALDSSGSYRPATGRTYRQWTNKFGSRRAIRPSQYLARLWRPRSFLYFRIAQRLSAQFNWSNIG